MGKLYRLMLAALGAQVLATGMAQAAGEIGDVIDVLTAAYGQPPALDKRELFPAETVYADEVVETVPAGGLTVQFHDGSALTLGGDSRVVLDQFVYDPNQGADAIELGTGVFRFISGELGHGEGFQVNTPTASIGVRGTDFVVVVMPDGATKVGTVSGLVNAAQRTGNHAIDLLPGSFAVIRPDDDAMEVGIAPVPVDDAFALALWFGGDVYVALAGVEPAAGAPPAIDDCATGSFGCGDTRSNDPPAPPAVQPAVVQPAAQPSAGPGPAQEPAGEPADNDPPDRGDDHDAGHGNNPDHHDPDNPGHGSGGYGNDEGSGGNHGGGNSGNHDSGNQGSGNHDSGNQGGGDHGGGNQGGGDHGGGNHEGGDHGNHGGGNRHDHDDH